VTARRWLAIGMIPMAAAGLWLFLGNVLAGYSERAAEEAWVVSAEPTEALVARYPQTPVNDDVRRLDELCRPLGIAILPDVGVPRARGPEDDVLAKTSSFVSERQQRGSDERVALPDEVSGFLAAHTGEADAVEAFLDGRPDLRWDQDLGRGGAAPIMPVVGPRQLAAVLLARSLEADARGDAATARRALEASANLIAALQRRAELVVQLVAIAMVAQRNGVLRALRDAPPGWRDRLAREDFRAPVLRSLQLETWTFAHLGGAAGPFVGEKGFWSAVQEPFLAPWLRLSAGDFSRRVHDAAIEARDGDSCSLDPEAFDKAKADAMPRWNILGRIAMPAVLRSWTAVVQGTYDLELTRHVLAARGEESGGGETPPRSLGPSAVCPGVKWQEVVRADGSVSIYPDRDPFPRQKPLGTVSYVLAGK